jgi:hypothetical protein
METLLHAYEAYERRVIRGEFSTHRLPRKKNQSPFTASMAASLGDLMIKAGLKLKRRALTGKSMAWSPMTGSKE